MNVTTKLLLQNLFHRVGSSASSWFHSSCAASIDHIQRTANNFRMEITSDAVVKQIRDVSPTVKQLTMEASHPQFMFKPGQWVDMFIPGVDRVGGYSMCSSPSQLTRDRTLELAVKFSDHPPAYWVHTQCKAGSRVKMRVGGDFYHEPSPGSLLLIAGGVGINPLLSILLAMHDAGKQSGPVHLMYSSQTEQELIFKDVIDRVAEENPSICADYFITRQTSSLAGTVTEGRINKDSISSALERLGPKDNITSYICGPSPMIDNMEQILSHLGLDKQQIRYEKWW